MIRRNPDVIAIAVLLFGLGAYSLASEARVFRVTPYQRVVLSHAVCRVHPQLPSFRIIELIRD